jgi:hypothetical protein
MLEIEVGEVDVARVDVGQDVRERGVVESRRRQQDAPGFVDERGGNGRYGEVGHCGVSGIG